ncbi:Histone-like transcription factor (CBF/NF-Y) and archaeal histone [Fragilaria crotonensis]|nr:Histone-like transcription factor (CBF/NF-Y) and archaeal histone [Fragilaria crotonensis]
MTSASSPTTPGRGNGGGGASPETVRTSSNSNHNNAAMMTATGTSTTTAAIEFEPPLACVRRILKTALPNSTNVGKDASAAFCRASGIFVIYLTACANDFARENKRQTITANDVLAAVKELDFDEFTPQLTLLLDRYRATEKTKRDAKAAARPIPQQPQKQLLQPTLLTTVVVVRLAVERNKGINDRGNDNDDGGGR